MSGAEQNTQYGGQNGQKRGRLSAEELEQKYEEGKLWHPSKSRTLGYLKKLRDEDGITFKQALTVMENLDMVIEQSKTGYRILTQKLATAIREAMPMANHKEEEIDLTQIEDK